MNMNKSSAAFFEALYQQQSDPWQFASSAYETSRYQHIYDAIKHKHYKIAFEPGCSIGILTKQLPQLADAVYSIDISATAVAAAQHRCRQLKNVFIARQSLTEWCADKATTSQIKPDLIILSEIGYYFTAMALHNVVMKLLANSNASATLLACHWLGASSDHQLTGDKVHAVIGSIKGLQIDYSARYRDFRLDRWVKQ